MQTPNLQSSLLSVSLRACWVQIAHTSTELFVGSLGGTKQGKKGPCLINIPKAQSLLLSGFSPLSFLFFFDFCSVLQLFSVTKHPASRPLTLVSKQTERERVQGKGVMAGWGWWCGCEGEGWTRLLLLVTQTWLRASTSTMFALPHSLPPTERLSLPLSRAHALPPSLSQPSLSFACTPLSQSCYFGWKR